MLSDDLALTSIDGRHFRGWFDVLLPLGLREMPSWALLVCEKDVLIHAVISGRGAVESAEIPFSGTARADLIKTRDALGVDAVLAVTTRAFGELSAQAEREVVLGEHYTAQAVRWVAAVRKANRSEIWLEPPLIDLLPPLTSDSLERAFNLFVPDDTAVAAYVIADDRSRVEASVIAVKRAGRLSEVSTHAAIADRLSESRLANNWTAESRTALDRIGARFAPVSAAFFIERAALWRILSGPPDQLARELKNKTALIDPMPRWLTGLLGGAAAMAAAQRGAKKLSGFLPKRARQAAASVAEQASKRARESGAHPWQVLGFDPIELFRNVQRFYRVAE